MHVMNFNVLLGHRKPVYSVIPVDFDDLVLNSGGSFRRPFSQLIPLSRVAVQARRASLQQLEPCPSYVAWRTGLATLLS
jgi:hypothetical protein